MKEPKPTPCNECPFRRVSLPGYLGAATPDDFIAVATYGETPMPCHKEVNYESKNWEKLMLRARQCTGHAIYLGNTCKDPRNKEVYTMPADHALVFSTPVQFIEHHGRGAANLAKRLSATAKKAIATKKGKKKR